LNYFLDKNQGDCHEIMSEIFGSENKRKDEKLLVQEIDFYEADDFEAIVRVEMCDDCEWPWIHLNVHIEDRGGYKRQKQGEVFFEGDFEHLSSDEDFKLIMRQAITELRNKLERREDISSINMKIQRINK